MAALKRSVWGDQRGAEDGTLGKPAFSLTHMIIAPFCLFLLCLAFYYRTLHFADPVVALKRLRGVNPVSHRTGPGTSISFVVSQGVLAWARHIADIPHTLKEFMDSEMQLKDGHIKDEHHLGRKPVYHISL